MKCVFLDRINQETHTLSIHSPGSPEGVLVRVSETGSVRVSWEAVENADHYTVSLSQAVGDDQEGLCRDDSHSASVTVHVPTASIAVREDVASNETHVESIHHILSDCGSIQ